MVSRINIGPDGGPYIAINENNGDIELEDNSGNVVAKWDETNTQWDFSTNDIQNVGSLGVQNGATFNGSDLAGVGSLDVDLVEYDGLSEGETVQITDFIFGGVVDFAGQFIQYTEPIGTSATPILTLDSTGEGALSGDVNVLGKDINNADYFVDRVGIAGGVASQTIIAEDNAATRSYARVDGKLELTMGSSTYWTFVDAELVRS